MTERWGSVGLFSAGMLRLRGLAELLGADQLRFRPGDRVARELDAVAGWGHKATAARAREYARRHGLPYLALEDGFLRSVGLAASEPPLSLVVDDLGIYYDARGPSRLEALLQTDARLTDAALLERAERFRARMVASGVSKYNHAPEELPGELPGGELVLVVDQTYDDASVSGALADARSFDRALECALDEHPKAQVVVKVHPATVAGKKRGYLAGREHGSRVTSLGVDVSPQALLRRVRHAYVVSSQLGLEALLAGVPVTCFGQAFYAGWGLTTDQVASPRRTRRLQLSELVAGALLLYPRYRHPLSGQSCEAEAVLEHLALQRGVFAENSRNFVCFGMSYWKRPFVRRYLRSPGRCVRFVASPAELGTEADVRGATGVVWASRKSPQLEAWAGARGVPLWSMEDGFLRSAGLGSDLTAPGSLVLDPDGIYYDPSRASRLEEILQHASFGPGELERAAALRKMIVASGVSKYNLPSREPLRLGARPGQRVVLVPGQVADDASVRLGTQSIGDNLALLRAVRGANPDAYLLYKPHPDVLSGNRAGALHGVVEPPWDALVGQVPLSACLALSHEVHTMTSLVGFEALLRGLPVVTYGQPFYAGWGLTRDHAPLARRTRRLQLDELVAGALLRYPRYVSWSARCFVSAEDKVRELQEAGRRDRVPLPRLAIKLRSLARSGAEWWHGRELRRA
ncbi:MAG: capsular polysaccharide biosynthesis protein [Myxococcales bacterium]|nr:MAG: capsular polysaccharide biosynthesis protein [Myxococcales bacterium]